MIALVVVGVTLGGVVMGYAASLALTSQNLTVVRTCIITVTPSSTTAVSDTYVASESATTNFGTANTMDIQMGNSGAHRIYISFDLTQCSPAIPSSATVLTAVVRVFVTAISSSCRTYDLYRATGAWTETDVTWNTQPTVGGVTGSVSIGSPASCTIRAPSVYGSWDVATDVQAFVSGGVVNRGWMIRDSAESSGTPRTSTFTTKNAGTLAQTPQLVVVYRT